jgi:Peptidase family M23
MGQGLIGHHRGAVGKHGGKRPGEPRGELDRDLAIAAADVGVRERGVARQAIPGARQRVAKIAQQQMLRIRQISGMTPDLSLQDKDLTSRQELAQMAVGATVAEPELKHRPWQIHDAVGGEVEARSLRLEPTDEAVETTHSSPLGRLAEDCRSRSEGQPGSRRMRAARSIMIIFAAWLAGGAAGTELQLTGELVQGGVVRGRVAPESAVSLNGRALRVTPDGWFVIGFGRDALPSAELSVRAPGGEARRHLLQIAPRTYPVQRIDGLPPRQVVPSDADLVRIRADAALLDAARGRDTLARGFTEQMAWPAIGPISGVFGSQRILNGQPRTPHRGVDIAAPRGSPVGAMASGVVSLAETGMYFTGGTVMLDHGHGLHSIYVHLDQVRVTVGQQLRRGQTLGTVGASGRATGPHLHWGVYWFDQAVDPALLVEAMPR